MNLIDEMKLPWATRDRHAIHENAEHILKTLGLPPLPEGAVLAGYGERGAQEHFRGWRLAGGVGWIQEPWLAGNGVGDLYARPLQYLLPPPPSGTWEDWEVLKHGDIIQQGDWINCTISGWSLAESSVGLPLYMYGIRPKAKPAESDPLPPGMPDPPEGMRWEARPKEWKNYGRTTTFVCHDPRGGWGDIVTECPPSGISFFDYFEAVPVSKSVNDGMPDPPEGMRWEHRGKAWRPGEPKTFVCHDVDSNAWSHIITGTPIGRPFHNYFEAVPVNLEAEKWRQKFIDCRRALRKSNRALQHKAQVLARYRFLMDSGAMSLKEERAANTDLRAEVERLQADRDRLMEECKKRGSDLAGVYDELCESRKIAEEYRDRWWGYKPTWPRSEGKPALPWEGGRE